jgi:large subunit ribosomal protein L17
MRHHGHNRIFGRTRDQRAALLRSLARSLILHEGIKTTEAKAKELRPYIEKLVTRGKNDTLANRRLVAARLGNDKEVSKKLFEEIAPKYKERSGGYTRIVRLYRRPGDAATVAHIAFV